uniref:DB domain-containing protein n=1 Tax=Rhabditophanes sp. KR3021 TaxID=114890 RepID=A0AC35TK31_9BILA
MSPFSSFFRSYSAVKAKAMSTNTLNGDENSVEDNKVLPSTYQQTTELQSTSPNQEFLNCCQSRGLPDACNEVCSYENYSRKTLQQMFFNAFGCPLSAVSNIHFCASKGRDHTNCCIEKGIGSSNLDHKKCLIFCEKEPSIPIQLDMSYVSCFDRFDDMMSCFNVIKKTQPNLYYYNQDNMQSNVIPIDYNNRGNFKKYDPQTAGSWL